MPDVVAIDVNLPFGCQQVKRCKLQVADGTYLPAVVTVRIHIMIHSFEPLLVTLVEDLGISILRYETVQCSNGFSQRRLRCRPTEAYCWRSSSCAFADQGINSASRQIQSV